MGGFGKQVARIQNLMAYWQELGGSAAIALARRNFKHSDLLRLKVRGIRTPVYCRPNDSDFQVLRQVVGRRESDVLPSSVQPRLIIDGGANVGYSSLIFADHYPNAKIISVEPEQRNCELFEKNCRDYPNIKLIQGAIWHEPARLNLTDSKDSDSFQVRSEGDGSIRAYTIPELIDIAGEKRVDLLKLDIEGAEVEVLSHNTQSWIHQVDVLLVELHERLRPGCDAALDLALKDVPHKRKKSGEYDYVDLAAL